MKKLIHNCLFYPAVPWCKAPASGCEMPASVRAKGAAGAAILLSEICLELKADVQEGIEGIGIVVLRVFREAVCLSHARLVKSRRGSARNHRCACCGCS